MIRNLKWKLDLVRSLVQDPLVDSRPRQVEAHFSLVKPEPAPSPELISTVPEICHSLSLDPKDPEFIDVLSGNKSPTRSWSLCYGGHQFGSWAGQLGDGRAISVGQVDDINGKLMEIQLKGAGMTPYSRFADGYAVLRSSIREYLCAEAMHHLGVPTSRSLALIKTATLVQREVVEQGAIVARVSPSWIRFGSFEILYARGDTEKLKILADFVIKHHFPTLAQGDYAGWLQMVVDKTADMVAHWQAVGTFN